MWLIKNKLYKQKLSFSSKFPISYSRGKFGRQRRNFPLAPTLREICDFERPQRTKESEVRGHISSPITSNFHMNFLYYIHVTHEHYYHIVAAVQAFHMLHRLTDILSHYLSVGTSIVKSVSPVVRRMWVPSGLLLKTCFSLCI